MVVLNSLCSRKKSSLLIGTRRALTEKYRTPIFRHSFDQRFQTGRIAEYRNIEEKELLNKNNSTYSYKDFNLRWQYRFKKDDAVSISIFSNEDHFRYDFEIDQPFYTAATQDDNLSANKGSAIKISNRWRPWWQTKLTFVNSTFENVYHANYTADLSDSFHIRTSQISELKHDHLSLQQHFTLATNQQLQFGTEITAWDVRFKTSQEIIWEPDPIEFDLNLSNSIFTTFLNYHFHHKNKLFVHGGLRLNRIHGLRKNKWEPRLSLKYQVPASAWLLKISLGTYHQFVSQVIPDLDRDNLGIDNGIWVTTELDVIPVLSSRDITIGTTFRKKGWTLDIEGYSKNVQGLSALNLRINRKDHQITPGTSTAMGLELLLQKKFNRYRTLLSYNLSQIKYRFPDFNANQYFPASHDRLHYLQWNHLYRLGSFDLVFALHLGSGTPYTIPASIVDRKGEQPDDLYHELTYDRRNTERVFALSAC